MTPPVKPAETNLKTFDSDADLIDLKVVTGEMKRQDGVLHLDLGPGDGWPQLRMDAPAPLDWSGKVFSIEVKNLSANEVEVGLRLDDDSAADGWKGSWTDNAKLAPGEKARLILGAGADPMSYGMRRLPAPTDMPDARLLTGWGAAPLNFKHIVSWELFVHGPKEVTPLEVDNIGTVPSPSGNLDKIVDQFGQYSRLDWPGKVHDEAELTSRRDTEAKELAAPPQRDDLDRFGGWKAGPQLEASGFFRTEKVDGKWWLVDPDGHLFFSTGIDVVQPYEPTIVAGRENMFEKLPADDDRLSKFDGKADNVLLGPTKSGRTVDFAAMNLFRKYGETWRPDWTRISLERLQNWGFNTLGNWSSDWLKATDVSPRLPYVATSGIYGDHARFSAGDDAWPKMHDPYDPMFEGDVSRALAEITAKVADDPYCIGYFVENEMGWGDGQNPKRRFGVVDGVLNSPITLHAKIAFLAQLRQKYDTIAALNTAWGTGFADWDALNAPYQAPDAPNEAMQADLAHFSQAFAEKYFSTVQTQLKKLAPHHLYLGSRFAIYTPESVAAAAKYCDVVSFNIYKPRLDEKEWPFVNDLNKPAIVGEFHMGATDRGMFHPGLVVAKDQTDRARMYEEYVRSVLDNPSFVGCHWFQYADEPNTGRVIDGENYNIGFVDITDSPYSEMVAAAKEVNGEMYSRRSVKKEAPPKDAAPKDAPPTP